MALTDAQVRSFKPNEKRFKKSDGRGLYVEVMPTGAKFFRLACRLDGKQRTYTIGEYPELSLADARLRAAEYKKYTKQGIDPLAAAKEEKAERENTKPLWKDIAKDYLMLRQRSGAAMRTMQKLDRQINVTINALGNREVTDISADDVLAVVNPIADAGYVENAHEIHSRFSQVFRYAAAREHNIIRSLCLLC
jgi:hypothetical protein